MSSANSEEINATLARLTSMQIVHDVLADLEQNLPKTLRYHTHNHVKEVLTEAIRFAILDGISGRDLELLAVAASFHDAGFLVRYEDNEKIGAEMAEKAMSASGVFSADEVALVQNMIMDTRLPDGELNATRASSELSKYLLDADLSNFGREDFFDKLLLVEAELGNTHLEHLQKTYKLFSNHRWLTAAASKLRGEQKDRNRKRLEEMIEKAGGTLER